MKRVLVAASAQASIGILGSVAPAEATMPTDVDYNLEACGSSWIEVGGKHYSLWETRCVPPEID